MIVVAGTITVRSERREEAIEAALAMADATRREPGCLSYRFWADPRRPECFFVFEEWQDGDALARHFQTEHMAAFQQKVPGLLGGPVEVKRYEVSAVTGM